MQSGSTTPWLLAAAGVVLVGWSVASGLDGPGGPWPALVGVGGGAAIALGAALGSRRRAPERPGRVEPVVDPPAERARLEAETRQAQKMEALGRLAGGVAHDFSNILMVMMGHASLALQRLPAGDPSRKRLEEIVRAGDRGAALTGRLLALARRQLVLSGPLDLNAALRDLEELVRRLVGADVDVVLELAEGLPAVQADGGQVTEIVMILAANARDAMRKGGRLTLTTSDPHRDVGGARPPPAAGWGPYVLLAVSDTGDGMTPEALEHLFEPFFTTKERGRGVGLGLATVYGIVNAGGGLIRVESPPERGTTVSLWLPQAKAEARSPAPAGAKSAIRRGHETVLLVEDEAEIRSSLRTALADRGYDVVAATDGEEALEVARGLGRRVHLLVTDVVMPRLGGGELARRLGAEDPSLRVLYISGYSDDDLVRRGVSREDRGFLAKPFTPDVFLRKVREVLDARVDSRA